MAQSIPVLNPFIHLPSINDIDLNGQQCIFDYNTRIKTCECQFLNNCDKCMEYTFTMSGDTFILGYSKCNKLVVSSNEQSYNPNEDLRQYMCSEKDRCRWCECDNIHKDKDKDKDKLNDKIALTCCSYCNYYRQNKYRRYIVITYYEQPFDIYNIIKEYLDLEQNPETPLNLTPGKKLKIPKKHTDEKSIDDFVTIEIDGIEYKIAKQINAKLLEIMKRRRNYKQYLVCFDDREINDYLGHNTYIFRINNDLTKICVYEKDYYNRPSEFKFTLIYDKITDKWVYGKLRDFNASDFYTMKQHNKFIKNGNAHSPLILNTNNTNNPFEYIYNPLTINHIAYELNKLALQTIGLNSYITNIINKFMVVNSKSNFAKKYWEVLISIINHFVPDITYEANDIYPDPLVKLGELSKLYNLNTTIIYMYNYCNIYTDKQVSDRIIDVKESLRIKESDFRDSETGEWICSEGGYYNMYESFINYRSSITEYIDNDVISTNFKNANSDELSIDNTDADPFVEQPLVEESIVKEPIPSVAVYADSSESESSDED